MCSVLMSRAEISVQLCLLTSREAVSTVSFHLRIREYQPVLISAYRHLTDTFIAPLLREQLVTAVSTRAAFCIGPHWPEAPERNDVYWRFWKINESQTDIV